MKQIAFLCFLTSMFMAVMTPTQAPAVVPVGPGLEANTNRPGMDYKTLSLKTADECLKACNMDPQCKAFSIEMPQNLSATPLPVCRLKNGVPAKVADNRFISGLKGTGAGPLPTIEQKTPVAKDTVQLTVPAPTGTPPKIDDSSILKCPPSIIVSNIEIGSNNVPMVPPGFMKINTGNQPVEFKLYGTGQPSGTQCFCDYAFGNGPGNILHIFLNANLAGTGYTKCSAKTTCHECSLAQAHIHLRK